MRIGVDLGGTKIEAAALDEAGRLLERLRVTTPAGDYAATVAAVVDLVHRLEAGVGTGASVGIATPGAVSRASGTIKNANSVCLNGMPLQRDLESALARPVRMANDANCFALSEAVDGAAANAQVVFGVIVGTGTGGGLVVHGRVVDGINRIAGEWGHNPLPWPSEEELPGPSCYCGKRGCIETFLSGPGMSADYAAHTGNRLSAQQVVEEAGGGGTAAVAVLERYCDRMARALASVINVLDPDVIVLGGGLSNVEALYRRVPELWGRYVFSDRVDTALVPPVHGDSSGVRGAAWLWPAQ